MNEKVFLRAIYLLLFWSFWGFNLEYLTAARCAWASTSSNGTWRFFHIFDTNIPSLFMEELQQLNLATELPGQKIQVIVSLFSVPKMMYSLWYDDPFWLGSYGAIGMPLWWRAISGEGCLSQLLSKVAWAEETQKVQKAWKLQSNFWQWHLPQAAATAAEMFRVSRGKSPCYCCPSVSQSLECSCLPYTRTWLPPHSTEQLQFPTLVVRGLLFFLRVPKIGNRVCLGIYLVPTLQRPWR